MLYSSVCVGGAVEGEDHGRKARLSVASGGSYSWPRKQSPAPSVLCSLSVDQVSPDPLLLEVLGLIPQSPSCLPTAGGTGLSSAGFVHLKTLLRIHYFSLLFFITTKQAFISRKHDDVRCKGIATLKNPSAFRVIFVLHK